MKCKYKCQHESGWCISPRVQNTCVHWLDAEVDRLTADNEEYQNAQHDLFMEYCMVKKERDAAIADLKKISSGSCRMCAFDGENKCWGNIMVGLKDLRQKLKEDGCPYCCGWQWHGVQDE